MNDLKILHEAWGTPRPPRTVPRPAPRSAAGAGGSVPTCWRSRRRLSWIWAAADRTGSRPRSCPGGPAVQVAAAAVLEQAAVAAETKPFTAPRDDQWIYVEDRYTRSDGGTGTLRKWRRVDVRGIALIDESRKLEVEIAKPSRRSGKRSPGLGGSYKELAALPTDPDALLRWAYALARNATGGGMNDDGDIYLIFNHMLRENVLPPQLEGAIFRALKQIPGVTVERSRSPGARGSPSA
jgi:hypothetical protein